MMSKYLSSNLKTFSRLSQRTSKQKDDANRAQPGYEHQADASEDLGWSYERRRLPTPDTKRSLLPEVQGELSEGILQDWQLSTMLSVKFSL